MKHKYVIVEAGDVNAPQTKVGSKIKLLQKIKSKDKKSLSIYPNTIVTVKKLDKQVLTVETFDGETAVISVTTKYKVVKV
jgi:hypothetical protein